MIIALNTNAGSDLSIDKYWPTPKHVTYLSKERPTWCHFLYYFFI